MTIAVMILLTAALFAYSLLVPQEVEQGAEKTRLAFLRERRDVLYDNLRDLTFEHRAGKLPDADYQAMRAAMEDEAALLLAEIDSLENPQSGSAVPAPARRANSS
ncbi:MAG TPA: hypothetical protein VFB00_02255 [Terriglobales bacterium]|nr:hypothetical protein [Terriglobales bacterium]